MPNLSQIHTHRPARPEPLFLFDARRPARPATCEMISQVITHADQATPLVGGRLRLRLSRPMFQSLLAQGRLGREDERLTDLTVVWDEAEGQVMSVRDDARLRDAQARFAEWDSLWDEESYVEPRSVAA